MQVGRMRLTRRHTNGSQHVIPVGQHTRHCLCTVPQRRQFLLQETHLSGQRAAQIAKLLKVLELASLGSDAGCQRRGGLRSAGVGAARLAGAGGRGGEDCGRTRGVGHGWPVMRGRSALLVVNYSQYSAVSMVLRGNYVVSTEHDMRSTTPYSVIN